MVDNSANRRTGLIGIGLLIFVFYLAGWYMERIDYSIPSGFTYFGIGEQWRTIAGSIGIVGHLVSPRVLRHLIPIYMGWWIIRKSVLGFIQVLYDLPDEEMAAGFLARAQGTPLRDLRAIPIRRPTFEKDRLQNPILRYGGSAIIDVEYGDAVWTERNSRFYKVYGGGKHQLEKHESVRGVVDIRRQERTQTNIRLVTKEGILLQTDLTLVYRIDPGDQPVTESQPYPFSAEGVQKAGYYQLQLADGHVDDWDVLPMEISIEQLRQIVARRSLDALLFQPDTHKPIAQISDLLLTKSAHKLKAYGLLLESVLLGRLEVPDLVVQQRLQYWQGSWQERARRVAVVDQAQAASDLEQARSQAKSETIQRILHSMREAQGSLQTSGTREMLALRLVDAMERISRQSPPQLSAGTDLTSRIGRIRSEIESLD